MPRPKLAHVSTVDLSLRYLLLNQMISARSEGYEVTAISSPGLDVAEVERAGIRHIGVPMSRRFTPIADLIAFWRLFRVMRRERFEIVHTHTPKAALLGQYAALLARVPTRVHTIHGLYFPGHMKERQRWLYILLERVTLRFAHMNLSQNPEDIPVAIKERICRPDRILLLGNGIDLQRFDPTRFSTDFRRRKRSELGLTEDQLVVGMVARFVAEKGHQELLEAAQMIRTVVPSARFLLIGGIEESKADALDPNMIDRMGLTGIVHYLGHRLDVPELYAVMDILALPSHREGFPRTPMEAAAMGIPAVVTNVRGCRQTVDHGLTGYIVPPRDARSLAEALLDLLRDEQKRRRFGLAARAKAATSFDERLVFERILEAYRRVLKQGAHPAAPDFARE